MFSNMPYAHVNDIVDNSKFLDSIIVTFCLGGDHFHIVIKTLNQFIPAMFVISYK